MIVETIPAVPFPSGLLVGGRARRRAGYDIGSETSASSARKKPFLSAGVLNEEELNRETSNVVGIFPKDASVL